MTKTQLFCLLALASATTLAHAAQPQDFLADFQQTARQENPQFAGFDAGRGAQFFSRRHGDWSCSTCHTDKPTQPGKHAVTDKTIAPLAPAANPERFADPRKVAKWFKRNCNDVLKRECSAAEKGDVLTYLLSLKS
ncbi:MAG: DUF1924 domain-containing protein [Methylococcaceae bacterium]|nr:DUF1924 domain-containing protein [Methylococcaceae bacterium]